ncbi:hypothetical protein J3P88_12450 [Pseudomonas sp. Z3-6]|uniref:hypothetical protein n=1 Tax=Pseudomonas sp. Z3-6 TaxID=2817411 RepID=UPI003DA808AC
MAINAIVTTAPINCQDPEFKGVKMKHARLDEKGFFLDFYYDDRRWTNKPFLYQEKYQTR